MTTSQNPQASIGSNVGGGNNNNGGHDDHGGHGGGNNGVPPHGDHFDGHAPAASANPVTKNIAYILGGLLVLALALMAIGSLGKSDSSGNGSGFIQGGGDNGRPAVNNQGAINLAGFKPLSSEIAQNPIGEEGRIYMDAKGNTFDRHTLGWRECRFWSNQGRLIASFYVGDTSKPHDIAATVGECQLLGKQIAMNLKATTEYTPEQVAQKVLAEHSAKKGKTDQSESDVVIK